MQNQPPAPAWTARLAGQGIDELLAHLTLHKVLANPARNQYRFLFHCDTMPAETWAAALRRAIRAAMPKIDVSICLGCPGLAADFQSDPTPFVPLLTAQLLYEMAGSAPWFRNSRWRVEGGALRVSFASPAAVEYMTAYAANHRIERLLQDVFALQLPVRFDVDGELEGRYEELAQRRRDEEAAWLKQALAEGAASHGKPRKPDPGKPLFGKAFTTAATPMIELRDDSGRVTVEGRVVKCEVKELRGGLKLLWLFTVTDFTNSIQCKAFLEKDMAGVPGRVSPGDWVRVRGDCQHDAFARDIVLLTYDVMSMKAPERLDEAEEKRVELHLHTQMSTLDGMSSAKDLIARAAKWGHPAIAITDHGVVQAYPEAFDTVKKLGIKLIPGMEGYLVDDSADIAQGANGESLAGDIVVLDIETTGLSAQTDRITEIGAVRMREGRVLSRFNRFVNPGVPIPEKIVKLTGITDDMVEGAPPIADAIGPFVDFCAGAVLAAHNAAFDLGFLRKAAKEAGRELPGVAIDTLALSRALFPHNKSHKLGNLCKQMGIVLTGAHRAVNDAEATAKLLTALLDEAKGRHEIATWDDLNTALAGGYDARHSCHIILLAQNATGLENLYKLVSISHTEHHQKRPLIPRSLIAKHREGLIVGSACEAGELIRAILDGKGDADLRKIAAFYDYLEIQPIGNNEFLCRQGRIEGEEGLRDINRAVVRIADELGKPCVATGDVHFLDPEDATYRAILMAGQGFEDAAQQAPLYFKTTQEMLDEFAYLGEAKAREVVIDAPRRIADSVEKLRMFPEHPLGQDTFQPSLENAAEDIRRMSEERALSLYGDPLPDIVRARLEKELGSIIGYGFATLYMIAHLLVKKSLSDGYLVGSRGSVGSSLVAHLLDITEVNALPPHYVCPQCHFSTFDVDKDSYPCGTDLPPQSCPECGAPMNAAGYDIPFEVFLGFEGDKVPDIDLNFSGVYQPNAHKYVEELFGKGYVFRAGTITTIAEKTAYGYVLKYLEERGIPHTKAEIERLAMGCTGVKRSTGQHPGGMVVLPKEYRITQFTPIQFPADDKESGIITTHFDFGSLHDILVKLDILGHDDPTMIRMLEDLTGVNAREIPLNDPKTMSLFVSTEALGVTPAQIDSNMGTLGVPEFGTKFVRQMLEDTMPTTMAELLRISGLSHGTDVWLGNAQDLIKEKTATLRECICTRDDIMNQLIAIGVAPKMSFDIMESVRKGKGLKDEMERAMREKRVPDWFIDSCKKIKYMFPKAHAAAYVMMAFRIAWFKVYHPKAYYAAYLSVRATSFDAVTMVDSIEGLKRKIAAIEELGKAATARDKEGVTVMEIVVEMLARGIAFLPIDVYRSDATQFLIEGDGIRPPISSLGGVGESAALAVARARQDGEFLSIEDLQRRTHISSAVVETLKGVGALKGMADTSQVSLFQLEGFL